MYSECDLSPLKIQTLTQSHKGKTLVLYMPALFMMTQTQTAEHQMAALVVVFFKRWVLKT